MKYRALMVFLFFAVGKAFADPAGIPPSQNPDAATSQTPSGQTPSPVNGINTADQDHKTSVEQSKDEKRNLSELCRMETC